MLDLQLKPGLLEVGCDEAGRGCLAGPVVAAAVVLPAECSLNELNDSKVLSEKKRFLLRPKIEEQAIAWGVAFVLPSEIDEINILNASIEAMHRAILKLETVPEFIAVDGNRFHHYPTIPHETVVKGDGKFMNIAAASVLAKTYRDDYMQIIDKEFPEFNWKQNKGYPTKEHRAILQSAGPTPHHRNSFKVKSQLSLAI